MSSDLCVQDRRGTGAGRRAGARMVAAAGTVLVLGGCSGRDLGLPEGASDRGRYVDTLWLAAWVAAGVVGVFVFGLIVWTVVHYRRRSDDEIPVQVRYNLPIEVLYTIAPVIVVLVLFFHTVRTDTQIFEATGEVSHEILVVGEKWSWSFNHLEEQAVGGQSVYTVGTPADRPTLVLPVDETVRFELRSQDVVHAFWVPAFYFKMDVLPGRENSFTMTPTREGTYEGRCSELCGTYHSRMLFTVEIVSRADYDSYLRDLQAAGNVGVVEGASVTDEIAGTNAAEAEEATTP